MTNENQRKICFVCKTEIKDESQCVEIALLVRDNIYKLHNAHLDCWNDCKSRHDPHTMIAMLKKGEKNDRTE